MDTFSLLTGIASGVAASLICQRVQPLSTLNDRLNRLTARIDDFERSVADKSDAFDKRIDYAIEQLNRINEIEAAQYAWGRKTADRLDGVDGRLEKLEAARNSAAKD